MTDHDMYSWVIKHTNPHRPYEVVSLFNRLTEVLLQSTPPNPDMNIFAQQCIRYDEIMTALKQLKYWHRFCHKYNLKIQNELCKKGVTGTWNSKRKSSMPLDIRELETGVIKVTYVQS